MPENFPKCYLAAPFFSPAQVSVVESIESVIEDSGWRMFSPRKGSNAIEMNSMISDLKAWKEESGDPKPPAPPHGLRLGVFNDNWMNIDDADLLIAVIDDFDPGVLWEVGYSFARHVPIVTVTAKNYGCNLMLAHSIIGHTKTYEEVSDVLKIGNPSLSLERDLDMYGAAIAEIQQKYKSNFSLKEGPGERDQ